MAFNIQTHNKNQGTLPQSWHAQQTDRAGYNKYEEKMSKARALFSWIGVVVLSIFSFSGYFIYLMKSKNGQQSLQNLKDRKIIHYIKSQGGTDSSSSRKTEDVANQSLNPQLKDTNKKEKFDPQTIIQKVDAEVIKNCVQHSNTYKKLFNNLVDLQKNGKIGILLDKLNEKSPVMARELEKLIYMKEFDEAKFVENFAPFFKDISNLESSIHRAQQLDATQISDNEKSFNEFSKKLSTLKDSNAWLLSLRNNSALFSYACNLLSLGPFYTIKFNEFLEDPLWESCLRSMDNNLVDQVVDKKVYQKLQDDFKKHKSVHAECSSNLVQGFSYNLYDYLESRGNDYSEYRRLMCENAITSDYIKSYFDNSGVINMYEDIKSHLTDETKRIARSLANYKYQEDQQKQKEDEQKAKSTKCVEAFDDIKRLYNENEDTIKIISNVKPFLKATLGLKGSDPFFEFIQALPYSTEVKNYNEPTSQFYRQFKNHFEMIDAYKTTLTHLSQFRE